VGSGKLNAEVESKANYEWHSGRLIKPIFSDLSHGVEILFL